MGGLVFFCHTGGREAAKKMCPESLIPYQSKTRINRTDEVLSASALPEATYRMPDTRYWKPGSSVLQTTREAGRRQVLQKPKAHPLLPIAVYQGPKPINQQTISNSNPIAIWRGLCLAPSTRPPSSVHRPLFPAFLFSHQHEASTSRNAARIRSFQVTIPATRPDSVITGRQEMRFSINNSKASLTEVSAVTVTGLRDMIWWARLFNMARSRFCSQGVSQKGLRFFSRSRSEMTPWSIPPSTTSRWWNSCSSNRDFT